MKMKKIFAAMAATAITAGSFAAMSLTSASAATTEIPYTQSEGSLSTDNDGRSVRRNIYNIWTEPKIADISGDTAIENNITINFTVEGLNDGDVCNAWIAGSIGGASVWTLEDAGDNAIKLNGNGDYTVSWAVPTDSANVDCVILQTDINYFSYGDFSTLAGSGINLKVNSITTGVEDTTEPPTDPATDPTTDGGTTTTTTAKGGDTTTTTTTAKGGTTTTTAKGGSTTTTTKPASNGGATETSAATGDAGVGVAAAALVLAGTAAIAARKRK